jgi:hypothetical protein
LNARVFIEKTYKYVPNALNQRVFLRAMVLTGGQDVGIDPPDHAKSQCIGNPAATALPKGRKTPRVICGFPLAMRG